MYENKDASLEALKEIRTIMDRSARFISLSGWSGVWAGCAALAGAAVAFCWMQQDSYTSIRVAIDNGTFSPFDSIIVRFIVLALTVLAVALAGGFYFTWRKAQREQQKLWNNASRQMLLHLFIPLFVGGFFTLAFVWYGYGQFIAPISLSLYGLGLIGASRYTLSDIRYLGMIEVALGCACIFFPGYGLYFWALGFGCLHILYGVIMWNKYDK